MDGVDVCQTQRLLDALVNDWTEDDAFAALATLPGVTRRSLQAIRSRYRTFAAAAAAPKEDLASQAAAAFAGGGQPFRAVQDLRAHLHAVRARASRIGARLITEAERDWPVRLGKIDPLAAESTPPSALYVRGDLAPLDTSYAVAVVGSRRPDVLARQQATSLGNNLARAGISVISGGAAGVDSIAQAATLDAGGHTVAVLGTGVDIAYPARNRKLFERIVDCGGALVSEHAPGEPARKGHFPARNRIISGLVDVVVVVAANGRSGTLITARHATRQGRPVCAIPGDPRRALSEGTNRLLLGGAAAVLEAEHVVEFLFELLGPDADGGAAARWLAGERGQGAGGAVATGFEFPLSDAAHRLLVKLDLIPRTADELSRDAGLTGGEVASAVVELEVVGLVHKVSGGYVLVGQPIK